MNENNYMTAQAAANALGVHRNTLDVYVRQGLLTAHRIGARGRRLFLIADIDGLRRPQGRREEE